LVAAADGVLDDSEREAFVQVVIEACGGAVDEQQVQRLLGDLKEQLKEDGLETRIASLGRTVGKQEHQREVLRIAGLLAHVSGGVSQVERNVLGKLASTFHLDPGEVDSALDAVKSALA
jgi:tellurite resistance protein